MAEKVFRSYRQMLSVLRGRGMNIPKGSAGSRVMRILERENYYNVINGYKERFIATPATPTTNETYKPGTTFDEIFALYCFDRELRNLFLRYLLKVENTFKTILAHTFSEKYGHDNYLKLDNFNTSPVTDQRTLQNIAKKHRLQLPADQQRVSDISAIEKCAYVTKLIGDVQQEIARQMSKNHPVVIHYMAKHGYIPLWVLVNVLTFGKITNFYRNMKDSDRIIIARQFGVQYDELHVYMQLLGLARNKCAHDERFYDFRNRTHIKTNNIRHYATLNIPTSRGGSPQFGTCDMFAIVIVFTQLLKKTEVREFLTALNVIIEKLSKSLVTITIDEIKGVMGFPANWRDVGSLAK